MNRMQRTLASLIVLMSALCFSGAAAAQSADVILHNGKVFTSNPDNLWAQAVAVRGNRIQAVGSNADVLALARPGTKLLDLAGRTVIPGLNDAHVHALMPLGVQLNIPDFAPGPGPTLQEVLDLIAQATQNVPAGTWLFVAVGPKVGDDPLAHRLTLDQVSPHHPVKLEMWTGHGMYLNTKGMQALGIAEDEPDPFGGFYERFPGTGVLNGVVHEYAEHVVRRRFAGQMSDSQIRAIYQTFIQKALTFGFTSVQNMSVGLTHARSVEILDQVNPALRWREICFPLALGESCDFGPSRAALVQPSGVKWIGDGTPIERLALLSEPYADRPDTSGRFNFPLSDFSSMLEDGLHGPRKKQQLLFHLVGDAAIDTLLDEMEGLAPAAHWRKRRVRIEHGDLVLPSDIARVRDLGIVIVQNPTHLSLPDLPQRLSPQRLPEAQPLQSLLQAGVHLALGTDGIGGTISPFLDIFLATFHPARPGEALTREQAVIAYTAGSAYAELQEDQKGSLTPGRLADLAVLSEDIFTAPPPVLLGTRSVLTMVDGQIVWDEGVVQPGPPHS
jgi:predicted amidohydrolase YtcJ